MGKWKIDKDINRLVLYNSHYEKGQRTKDAITVTFESAELNNLVEFGIKDWVVLGETKLILTGIKKEHLKVYYEKAYASQPHFFQNLGKEWNKVTNVEVNERKKFIQLNGLFAKNGKSYWVEWEAECLLWRVCDDADEWQSFRGERS